MKYWDMLQTGLVVHSSWGLVLLTQASPLLRIVHPLPLLLEVSMTKLYDMEAPCGYSSLRKKQVSEKVRENSTTDAV